MASVHRPDQGLIGRLGFPRYRHILSVLEARISASGAFALGRSGLPELVAGIGGILLSAIDTNPSFSPTP